MAVHIFNEIRNIFERFRRYFVVFGGFIILLTLGGFYTSRKIQYKLVNYMNNHSYSKGTITMSNSVWVAGLMLFGNGAAFAAGGFIEKNYGPKITALVGGWILSLNVCLMYFTMRLYLSILILSAGLLAGFGVGLAYGVALKTPCTWFPRNKGIVIGVVVSGYGISGTIVDFVQDALINSNNKSTNGFAQSFINLGLIYAVLQFIGAILLKNKSYANKELYQLDHCRNNKQMMSSSISIFDEPIEIESHQIFYQFDFWILWLTFLLNSTCFITISTLFDAYSVALHLRNQGLLVDSKWLLVFGGLFNVSGRIFWGYLTEKKSYKTVMLTVTLLVSFFVGTLNIMPFIPYMKIRLYTYGIWIVILNFLFAANLSVFPLTCIELFGLENFIENYGMLFTACSISGPIASFFGSFVYTNSDRYNYTVYFALFSAGCLLSFGAAGLTLVFRGKLRTLLMF